MTQKITVRVGGLVGSTIWDATPQVPTFDVESGSLPMLDAAHMYGGEGNASQFEFIVDDDIGEIPRVDLTKNLASHNVVIITEDASGTEFWIARGRIADKGWGRGTLVYGDARAAKVRVDDGNVDFRGLALVADWVRPEESGRARVLAALAAFCNGSPRLSTVIGTHLVAAGGEITMPANTYVANTDLPEIFRDCAEVEGKLWGAVIHHVGGSHLCMEYIDEGDHTTYACTLSITDDEPDLVTEFPPAWEQGDASIESGGDNPISHLVSRYGQSDDAFVVAANPDVIDAYDYWAESYNDSLSETASLALTRATAEAYRRRTEHVTHQVSILIPADKVHLVEAGMSIVIRAAAAMGGQYLGTDQTRRIAQAKKELVSPGTDDAPGQYYVHMQLDRPEKQLGERVGLPLGLKLCHDGPCGGGDINDFAGEEWQVSANGTHSITNIYTMVAAPDAEAAANWLDLTEWDGNELDFRAKISTTHAGVHGDSQGSTLIIGQSDVPAFGAHGPNYVPNKTFKWQVTRDSGGAVRVQVHATNDLFGDISGDVITVDAGEPFWIRGNLTASEINMRAWRTDEAEPGSWQATAAGPPATDLLAIMADNDVFAQTKMFDDESEFKLYSLEIASGYECPSCIHGGPNAASTDDTDAAPAGHQHDYLAAGGTAGQVALKSSATDWETGWAYIEQIATAETDDALVLAPDGAGGVEFRAETGGDSPWEEVTPDEVWRLKDDVYVLSSSDDSVYTWWGAAGTPVASGFFKLFALGGIDLNANDGTPGGGSTDKHYLIGGHGLVIPILSADPSGGNSENGQLYYNDTTDTFRAYQNGAWVDLIGGGGSGIAGELVTDTIIGDGATDTFALSVAPTGTWALVSTNGADLLPSEFAIVAGDVVFDVAPALDSETLVTFITGGFTVPAVDPGDIADPTLATAEDVANKLNDLMAELRTAGIIA